ncbi:MAG: DUF1501 domain-containing protein [Bradymonadia bacterium]
MNKQRLIERRKFLKQLSAATLGLGLVPAGPLGSFALGQTPGFNRPDRYYIFCYFSGGWDTLLALDPRDPRQFNNLNMRETQIQPGYELLDLPDADIIRVGDINVGPFFSPLVPWMDRVSIVRGMSMDTLTHEVGRRRFLTGKSPTGLQARGSSASTWLSEYFGLAEPIPNLSVRVENFNSGRANAATALAVNSTSDLLRTLRPGPDTISGRLNGLIDAHLKVQAGCANRSGSSIITQSEASRRKVSEMVEGDLAAYFDFGSNTPEMRDLRDRYGFGPRDTATASVQGALAVQAITKGISRCATIQVAGGLDTHFDDWESDQGPRQEAGFAVVANMMNELQNTEYKGTGSSWLDHTVIVGFSEFSRTALINVRGGRDHSLTNSCFLAGGNIRGNQVIGASSNFGLQPTKVDLVTGRSDLGGEVIRPEHILQTLFDEVGLNDLPDLRVPECRQPGVSTCDHTVAIPALLKS